MSRLDLRSYEQKDSDFTSRLSAIWAAWDQAVQWVLENLWTVSSNERPLILAVDWFYISTSKLN